MTEFLNESLTFYHVSVLLFGIAGLIILLRVLLRKRKSGEKEPHLAFRRWSKRFEQAGDELEKILIEHPTLSKGAIKLLRKGFFTTYRFNCVLLPFFVTTWNFIP